MLLIVLALAIGLPVGAELTEAGILTPGLEAPIQSGREEARRF